MSTRYDMMCRVCGGGVASGQRFCSACGTRVSVAPPRFTGPGRGDSTGRVARHRQTLGILWCVYGVLRIATGVVAVFLLRTVALGRFGTAAWPFSENHWMYGPPWSGWMLTLVAVYTLVASLLALLVGTALLARWQSGRVLAIVVGVLSLIRLPVGTVLAVYTLWVLGPATSGAEYDASLGLG